MLTLYPQTNRLFYPVRGQLRNFSDVPINPRLEAKTLYVADEIKSLVSQKNYPCVAALKSYHKDDYQVGLYGKFGTGESRYELREDLLFFLAEQKKTRSPFLSFWAVFENQDCNEEEFEDLLWHELSSLTSEEQRSTDWKAGSVSNPEDPAFRFSLEGHEFFVVGLHSRASRKGREFSAPALVFNIFEQFELLKEQGQYDSMVQMNRQRDLKFQGSINPMAEAHGDNWESIQFSGRKNSTQWKCPFRFFKKLVTP